MWENLTEKDKIKFQEYCDKNFGKTIIHCTTGEPMYLDEEGNLINTKIIFDLLFKLEKN